MFLNRKDTKDAKNRIYSCIRDIFGRAFARPYRMTATP